MGYSLIVHLSIGIIVAIWSLTVDSFFTYELGLYLLYAIAAQGVGFCWGRTGILPLGNAVFFGLAAYLAGYVLKNFSGNILLLLLPLCAIIPSIFAFLLAYILLRKIQSNSLFFTLITLALAMLATLIANNWTSVTGGFDGMLNIPSIANLDSIEELYWLILPISIMISFGLYYLAKTPFGLLLKACLSNELRVQFFGFSTTNLKATAFAISAFCAAIAGVLYAPHQSMVTPQAIGFFLSTQFVIWCALGGRFSVYGPLIGTLLIGFLTAELRDSIEYWEVIIAIIFILVVLYFPNGIIEIITNIWAKLPHKLILFFNTIKINAHSKKDKIIIAEHKKQAFNKLLIKNVGFNVGGNNILSNLNLTLDKANIYALIGPNGAGKTTVFNAITKNINFQKGQIILGDVDITKKTTKIITNYNLSRKFQIPSIFNNLTVKENLLIAIWSKRLSFFKSFNLKPLLWHTNLIDKVLDHFKFLKDKYNDTASSLSQGEKQMLEFAMVVCSEPNLMLLDEPCAGLSPPETRYMIESIMFFAKKLNSCVLIIEHDMDAVKKIADKVLVLYKGSLFFSGTMKEVQNNKLVQNIYSGGYK